MLLVLDWLCLAFLFGILAADVRRRGPRDILIELMLATWFNWTAFRLAQPTIDWVLS